MLLWIFPVILTLFFDDDKALGKISEGVTMDKPPSSQRYSKLATSGVVGEDEKEGEEEEEEGVGEGEIADVVGENTIVLQAERGGESNKEYLFAIQEERCSMFRSFVVLFWDFMSIFSPKSEHFIPMLLSGGDFISAFGAGMTVKV